MSNIPNWEILSSYKISSSESIRLAFHDVMQHQDVTHGVLCITSDEVSGAFAIFHGRLITGAALNTGERGFGAADRMLNVENGTYAYIKIKDKRVSSISQPVVVEIKYLLDYAVNNDVKLSEALQAVVNQTQNELEKTDDPFDFDSINTDHVRFTEQIFPETGIKPLLEKVLECPDTQNGILRILSPEITGGIGVFCGRYIMGAELSGGECGFGALKKILSVKRGLVGFFDVRDTQISDLKQSLGLDIMELIHWKPKDKKKRMALEETLDEILKPAASDYFSEVSKDGSEEEMLEEALVGPDSLMFSRLLSLYLEPAD